MKTKVHTGKEHMKKASIPIIGIDKGEESQVNGIDQIFKKIIEENFPKLKKDMTSQKQKKHPEHQIKNMRQENCQCIS